MSPAWSALGGAVQLVGKGNAVADFEVDDLSVAQAEELLEQLRKFVGQFWVSLVDGGMRRLVAQNFDFLGPANVPERGLAVPDVEAQNAPEPNPVQQVDQVSLLRGEFKLSGTGKAS